MNEITNEYGRGLYSLAEEEHAEESMLSEIRAVSSLFTGEYVRLLINPDIPKKERVALVGEALDGRVSCHLSNFVKLLTERGLASEIKGCFGVFEGLYYETKCIVRVRAESTVPLTDDQKTRLEEKLSSHIGRPVEVSYAITPSLIGGMRISYDNKLIDDSVMTKLREIGEKLSGLTL